MIEIFLSKHLLRSIHIALRLRLISFHFRWSAIAANLPGRTDNEIKNVWHTHLKKRVNPNQSVQNSNRKRKAMAGMEEHGPTKLQAIPTAPEGKPQNPITVPVSPSQSCSDISSSATNSSSITGEINIAGIKEECTDSSEELPEIDESFWSEALTIKNCDAPMDHNMIAGGPPPNSLGDALPSFGPFNCNNDDINFWLKVFMEAGDFQELPDI